MFYGIMSNFNFENNSEVGVINISVAAGQRKKEGTEKGASWKMNTPPIVEGAKRNKTAREGEQEIGRKKKLRRMRRAKKT